MIKFTHLRIIDPATTKRIKSGYEVCPYPQFHLLLITDAIKIIIWLTTTYFLFNKSAPFV